MEMEFQNKGGVKQHLQARHAVLADLLVDVEVVSHMKNKGVHTAGLRPRFMYARLDLLAVRSHAPYTDHTYYVTTKSNRHLSEARGGCLVSVDAINSKPA